MDRAIGVANVFVALVALSWFFYFLATRVAAVAVTLEVLVLHGLASIPAGRGKRQSHSLPFCSFVGFVVPFLVELLLRSCGPPFLVCESKIGRASCRER